MNYIDKVNLLFIINHPNLDDNDKIWIAVNSGVLDLTLYLGSEIYKLCETLGYSPATLPRNDTNAALIYANSALSNGMNNVGQSLRDLVASYSYNAIELRSKGDESDGYLYSIYSETKSYRQGEILKTIKEMINRQT